MSLAKNLAKHGVMLAQETTSYGSGTPTLSTTTDGLKVYETPQPTTTYQHDGSREGSGGNGMADLSPVVATGKSFKVDLIHYFKGFGAAYSASNKSTIHNLMIGLGFSATGSFTGGAEKWTYAPRVMDATLSSLVAELYARGMKWNGKGAYISKLVIESKNHSVPKITATLNAIQVGQPTDAAVASITYPAASIKTPKASAIGLTLVTGGQTFTPKLRDWTLTIERDLTERSSENEANGDHAGFHLGDLKVTFDCTIEHTAAVTGSPYASATAFDGDRVFENAGDVAIALTIAGGIASPQYNRLRINLPTAHLTAPPTPDRDGQIPLQGLSFRGDASTEELMDAVNLVTD